MESTIIHLRQGLETLTALGGLLLVGKAMARFSQLHHLIDPRLPGAGRHPIYALDLAKHVIQLHWVDEETVEMHRQQLKRKKVLDFFANRQPATGVVAMDACGSAHHWGRQLASLENEVRLVAAQFVRPFVKINKTNVADAEAIWETVQRRGMRFVPVKTLDQQGLLSLHRIRAQLIKVRTMQVNQLRGLLYEFGADLPLGRQRVMREVPEALPAMRARRALGDARFHNRDAPPVVVRPHGSDP